MSKLWTASGLFDRLVMANLTLLVMGMLLRVLPLQGSTLHAVVLGTQVLATVALLLLVVQLARTVQSVATLLRGSQGELVWQGTPMPQDTNGHLVRARHWLRRGKPDESVRAVFGDDIQKQARRLNDEDDAQR